MKLENYLISPNISVLETMKAIGDGAEGIVYVCDNERHLLGVVTDGDIRRHIIHGGGLDQSINIVMNKKPITLAPAERHIADECMQKYSITSVPIVDGDSIIQEIFFLDSSIRPLRNKINVPVVIMAGGKGTRLAPYTQILPKPLIPIGEKTIIEHIIDRFMDAGCNSFDIIVNYKRHLIKSYFRDIETSAYVRFIDEEEFLGTAGGLKLLAGKYNDSFFMTNCDILIDDDYTKIFEHHKSNSCIATIVSAVKNTTLPYGVIESTQDGYVASIKEKPDVTTVVNTGFYVLEPEFIDRIPNNTFIHITDVLKDCISDNKRVGMYPISGDNWMDMGQMDELQIMSKKILTN